MKIVQGDRVEGGRGSEHRGGYSHRQQLLDGEPGTENYSLLIATDEGRYSPRHKHNFEQFRYQLVGTANYSKTGKMKPGMIGYFPEGVPYGPQVQEKGQDLSVLVLQCGGASGGGYVGRNEQKAAAKELGKLGIFEDGIFHPNDGVADKRRMDGSRAVWEHVMKKPLTYPKPRYEAPILMTPDHYDWVPVDNAPGVSNKLFGIFTELKSAAEFFRLDAGAAFTVRGGRDIYFVIAGTGTLENEPYRTQTTLFLDRGEQATFTAQGKSRILHFHLPNLSLLERRPMPDRASGAAE